MRAPQLAAPATAAADRRRAGAARGGMAAPPFGLVFLEAPGPARPHPPPPPRLRPAPADGDVARLQLMRSYRLALRSAEPAALAAWRRATLRVRLVYADDGAAVEASAGHEPSALLAFDAGEELPGRPCDEVVLAVDEAGLTAPAFGLAVDSARHARRRFRIAVTAEGGPLEPGALTWGYTCTSSVGPRHRARRQPPKRPRPEEPLSPPDRPGSSHSSGSPPGPSNPPVPPNPAEPGVPPQDDPFDAVQLTRAVELLTIDDPAAYPPPAPPEASTPPPGPVMLNPLLGGDGEGGPSPASSGRQAHSSFSFASSSSLGSDALLAAPASSRTASPSPRGAAPPLWPPYRHPDEAAREAAVQRVEEAAARVRGAAEAAGVEHPTAMRRPPAKGKVHPSPPKATDALRAACAALAAALGGPALFDTRLFRSFQGRFRLRRLLADLRLSGSAEPVGAVLERWHALVRPEDEACTEKRDATLLAEHAWNLVAVTTGPLTLCAVDLLPVERAFIFGLLDRADWALRPFAGPGVGDQELRARSLAARAREHFHFDEANVAVELYFEAWACALRAGLSPSRLEAHLLRELVDILARVPGRLELAGHLAGKMYWVEGPEPDDLAQRALVLHTMGILAHCRGHLKRAREHLEAAIASLAPLPPEYCLYAGRIQTSLITTLTAAWDVRSALPILSSHKVLQGAYLLRDPAAPEWDPYHALRVYALNVFLCGHQPVGYRKVSLEGLCNIVRTSLVLIKRYEANTATHAHLLCLYGDLFALRGAWGKALAAYEDAQARYAHFPQYFPPSTPRIRSLRAAVARARGMLSAAGSPIAPALPHAADNHQPSTM